MEKNGLFNVNMVYLLAKQIQFFVENVDGYIYFIYKNTKEHQIILWRSTYSTFTWILYIYYIIIWSRMTEKGYLNLLVIFRSNRYKTELNLFSSRRLHNPFCKTSTWLSMLIVVIVFSEISKFIFFENRFRKKSYISRREFFT